MLLCFIKSILGNRYNPGVLSEQRGKKKGRFRLKRKIGAEFNNLRRKKKKQQCKVGREEAQIGLNWQHLYQHFLTR